MATTNKIVDLDRLSHFKAKLDLVLAGKADTSAIPTVNNASLTIKKNNTTIETFYANDNTNKTANITVPTTVAELSDASDYATTASLATVATSGSYTDLSDKPTIPTVNNATLTIQKNGANVQTFTANSATNATANITVPTKVSDLTNDSNYQTDAQVTSAINSAISGITGIDFQVVQSLPAQGTKGVIYLVANGGSTPNIYDEYIWITNGGSSYFEKIGTTAVDLAGYVQFTDIVYATDAEIDALFT